MHLMFSLVGKLWLGSLSSLSCVVLDNMPSGCNVYMLNEGLIRWLVSEMKVLSGKGDNGIMKFLQTLVLHLTFGASCG